MIGGVVNLAAIRATVLRCERSGAGRQSRREAFRAALAAMNAGHSPARAYADACAVLRPLWHEGRGPKGAA